MNYKDLENISYLSQQILTEAASEEHNVMNRWPYSSPYLQEARDGYGDDSKFKQDTDADSFRPGKDVPKVKKFGRISRAVPHGIGAHANRTQSKVTTIVGDDPGAARAVKMAKEKKLVKKDGKWVKTEELEYWVNSLLDEGYDLSDYTWDEMAEMYISESYNLYDIVLAHLIDEGYTDTIDGANAIMANMSEEWRESIIEGKKPLPVAKMKRKEAKLLDSPEANRRTMAAIRTPVGSPEREARFRDLERFDNINSVRTSVAKRGGKKQHSMPEIGRYKPKDED
jgi:hypothetical protein